MNARLEIVNAIGIRASVDTGSASLLDAMRTMGAQGWASGDVPENGWTLPYAMAETFDWRLIGARAFTFTKDGEEVHAVERLGEIYTRRDMPANKAKKLPAAIRYSRGAKGEEKDSADPSAFQYRALVTFKGTGRVIEAFLAPKSSGQASAPAAAPAPAPAPESAPAPAKAPPATGLKTEPATVTPGQLAVIDTLIASIVGITDFDRQRVARAVLSSLTFDGPKPRTRADLSEAQAREFTIALQARIAELKGQHRKAMG